MLSDAEVDARYDFIRDKAPKTTTDNAVNRWIKKQQNSPGSPLFQWSKLEIMDAVKANHRQTEASADQTQYPLTLRDVSGWMAVPLHAILPTLLSCSLILWGEQGMGKTSLAIIIALAMSRWHIARNKSDEIASYRLTQHLDLLNNTIPDGMSSPCCTMMAT